MNSPLFEIFTLDNLPLYYAGHATAAHSQRRFEMIWLEKGDGEHTIGAATMALQPRHIYCVVPGTVHQLSLPPDARGYILSFCGPFLQNGPEGASELQMAAIHRLFLHTPELPVDMESAEEITDLLALLLKEKQRHLHSRSDMLLKYFRLFIDLFGRLAKTNSMAFTGKIMHQLVDRFLLLLEENFRERMTISDYARMLFVTPNYLNHVIKTTTGQTAREHIQQRVLLEAKSELQRKGGSMKQIAYHLGFDDLAHFSKYFKNTAGKNFTTYRKQLVQQYL